ncbi:MAG: sugar ABC transporter ATP-binding protein [Sedimentisphaerales bacterium]|nr:sugar ABC transporter ATP-binding protein [Sedimentisphaerales bacterium]
MKSATSKTIFNAAGVSKSFPGVQALSSVDFDLKEGEVHALVGENGAGKSTLVSIIGGLQRPDSGQMVFDEQAYRPNAKREAEAHGIQMVMQELNLISTLTVAENIFVEKLPSRFGFVDYRTLNQSAKDVMGRVGLGEVSPDVPVGLLGVGQQQMVEIAAALSRRCRILILDEPTASLTDREIELLFAQINKLKAEGVGVIYISHRIEEVIAIADRITVLRDGKIVSTHPTSEVNVEGVIRMMVGRDLEDEHLRHDSEQGSVALRVVGLTVGEKVKNVSFEVHQGEILGVAGLMGSGRTETMRAVFGADRADAGQIYLHEATQSVDVRSPRDAVRNGIALLTEDRKEQGLLLPLAVRENISLIRLGGVSRLGWMDLAEERSVAGRFIAALSVRCLSAEQTVGELSGGNQQKVVIAKWMYRDCDILIFDEPTRGIDVGAKFEIYHMLGDLADKGKAIIFISSDLKELMAVCERIMVMSAGRIAATFDRGQWSEEKIISAAFSEYVGH